MKTIEITILKDENGLLYALDGPGRSNVLFPFQYRESGDWFFWLNGLFTPAVFEGGEFPTDYFRDACRAKHFIRTGEMPDGITIIKGKKLITNR